MSISFSRKQRCFLGSTTKITVVGKLAKLAYSSTSLIEPRFGGNNAARQGFSSVVVKPDNRIVPFPVFNTSDSPTELTAGENLVDFCSSIESCLSRTDICGAVGNKSASEVISGNIWSMIDSSLQGEDKAN